MTGAGRLSSDPQPVMAKAAPLCLSRIIGRQCQGPATATPDIPPRRSFRQGWEPEG
ncbi:hypothetical protein CI41S_79010 [Bradyrhizobium ivorense]|nr:hypothetical protein CI41S_79010 [Bradyrhizobium ivorense]